MCDTGTVTAVRGETKEAMVLNPVYMLKSTSC